MKSILIHRTGENNPCSFILQNIVDCLEIEEITIQQSVPFKGTEMFDVGMKGLRAGLVALLILGAIYVHFNSEMVDNWASNQVTNDDESGLPLLGIQADERWLVLQVEFPNNQFSTSTASQILIGDGSAEEYIDQMTAGSSSLSVTLFDEVWQAPLGVKNWGEDVAGERDHGADGNGACLLYTSPSPRDATLSRMPSSA